MLCVNKISESDCSLNEMSNCTFVLVINNYKLVKQLYNNKILVSCKDNIKIIEECKTKLNYKSISGNSNIFRK